MSSSRAVSPAALLRAAPRGPRGTGSPRIARSRRTAWALAGAPRRSRVATASEASAGEPFASARADQNGRPIAVQAALASRARSSRIRANGSGSSNGTSSLAPPSRRHQASSARIHGSQLPYAAQTSSVRATISAVRPAVHAASADSRATGSSRCGSAVRRASSCSSASCWFAVSGSPVRTAIVAVVSSAGTRLTADP